MRKEQRGLGNSTTAASWLRNRAHAANSGQVVAACKSRAAAQERTSGKETATSEESGTHEIQAAHGTGKDTHTHTGSDRQGELLEEHRHLIRATREVTHCEVHGMVQPHTAATASRCPLTSACPLPARWCPPAVHAADDEAYGVTVPASRHAGHSVSLCVCMCVYVCVH